jgi:hypothetical protein
VKPSSLASWAPPAPDVLAVARATPPAVASWVADVPMPIVHATAASPIASVPTSFEPGFLKPGPRARPGQPTYVGLWEGSVASSTARTFAVSWAAVYGFSMYSPAAAASSAWRESRRSLYPDM